jgi:MurNAc alpha-1-phosphate uridylyltransferase
MTLPSPTAQAHPPTIPIAAMLLAAGRGERMRPLTDTCPKPLLRVQGKPLMQWPLEALAQGGFNPVVINTAWLGEQIEAQLGSVFAIEPSPTVRRQLSNKEQKDPAPAAPTVALRYSHEGRDFGGALETAGGIARALPLLGDVFWVLAGDVFAPDFVFSQGVVAQFIASDKLAHLWLVPNPDHNPRGDFGLQPGVENAGDAGNCGLALSLPADDARPRYTYSTIGLYRAALFAPPWCDIPAGNPHGTKAPLAPLLRAAMAQSRISAELYLGRWTDVGTPARLQQLNTAQGIAP